MTQITHPSHAEANEVSARDKLGTTKPDEKFSVSAPLKMQSLGFRQLQTHDSGTPYPREAAQFPCVSGKMITLHLNIEPLHFRFELAALVLRFLSFESNSNVQVGLNTYFH